MFAFSVATGLLHEGQSLEGEIQGPKTWKSHLLEYLLKVNQVSPSEYPE